MKSNSIFALLILLSISLINTDELSAQGIDREIGLRASGLDNFNFIYKKARAEHKFIRYRAGAFNANYNNGPEALSLGLTLAIGVEKRKSIDNKLSFTHGFEPALQFNANLVDGNNVISLIPRIGYVLGFNLNVSDSFGINLETIPALSASLNIDDSGLRDNTNIGIGFNSNAVALSLVYRFKK